MNSVNIQLKSVAVLAGALVVLVIVYKYVMTGMYGSEESWKKGSNLAIPSSGLEKARTVTVTENEVKVSVGGQTVKSFYRSADVVSPRPVEVLLLHGQAFTSKTWQDPPMQTIQLLSALNFRTVAVDLPGYGNNKDNTLHGVSNEDFLEAFIKTVNLKAPVIVSPSMSGSFSLPYLFKDTANWKERSRGFVPVAPVGTGGYTAEQYQKLIVPTLMFCGSLDKSIGPKSVSDLKNLPNHIFVNLEGAKHPAYLDKPDEFHQNLYTFLLALQ